MEKPVVEIYGRPGCIYCDRAKAWCHARGFTVVYKDIFAHPEFRAEMLRRWPQAKTVPQIFIGKHHFGGFSDLQASEHIVQQLLGGS